MSDESFYLYALTTDPGKPMREAQAEIKRLRAERDEARRLVCNREWLMTGLTSTPERIAEGRGWDCFKEAQP